MNKKKIKKFRNKILNSFQNPKSICTIDKNKKMGSIHSKRYQKYSISLTPTNITIPNPKNIPSQTTTTITSSPTSLVISQPTLKVSPAPTHVYSQIPFLDILPYVEVQQKNSENENPEFLLTLPEEVLLIILNQLSLQDLAKLVQCNRFWLSYLPRLNDVWIGALKRSDFANQIGFDFLKKSPLRAMEVAAFKLRERECIQCGRKFREKDLNKKTCDYHRGQWDLVHNGVGPSGVRWICCGSTDKKNTVCKYPMYHTFSPKILSEHDSTIYHLFKTWIGSMPY